MAVLTSEPTASINGKVSIWNAAFNPIIFTIQREAGDVAKNNFRIEVKIVSGGKEITGFFSPGPDGMIKVNIFKLVKSFIRPVDQFTHTTTNYIDRNLFAQYSFSWREVWEDADLVTQYSDWKAPKTYYLTFTAMQLGERFGGNMAEYVTFNGGSSAKFLTEFAEPKSWEGLPYDISFILSEKLIYQKVFFKYTPLDINGNALVDAINLYYLLTEEGGKFLNEQANGGILLEDSAVPALLENTVSAENTLPQDVGVVRIRIPNVIPTAHKVKLEVFYIKDNEMVKITEDKYIRIERSCDNDPFVYLKWMNHLGAWDYYRFGFNQVIDADVSNDQVITRVVSDFANQDTIADVVKKSAVNKMTIGAHGLSIDQLRGLDWLRKGIKAQMLVSSNPVKWQTVIVAAGSSGNARETRKTSGSVKLTISLPESNIQNQ